MRVIAYEWPVVLQQRRVTCLDLGAFPNRHPGPSASESCHALVDCARVAVQRHLLPEVLFEQGASCWLLDDVVPACSNLSHGNSRAKVAELQAVGSGASRRRGVDLHVERCPPMIATVGLRMSK